MSLFQLGDFVLNSGKKSKFKIDCDFLTNADVECLAWMIQQMVGDFSSVEGIPRGGLLLADELQKYVKDKGPHLIVDDILTTGNSMGKAKDVASKDSYVRGKGIVGAVIFARGPSLPWVNALFYLHSFCWLEMENSQ